MFMPAGFKLIELIHTHDDIGFNQSVADNFFAVSLAVTKRSNYRMAAEQNFAASLLKQPFIIALLLVAVAIVIIWANQKPATDAGITGTSQNMDSADQPGDVASGEAIQLKPPTTAGAGQDTPRIVQKMNAPQSTAGAGSVAAPGLDSLLKGLEEKVAADPTNVNNRMLLAQTYNELGMQDKAMTEMRALQKDNPDNGRINLILSSMLSRSNDQEKIKESLTLLEKLSGDKTVQQYLVNMYKGDALIRSQDHDGALKYWKLALEDMPSADNRRALLEKRIADLSARENNAAKKQGGNS